MGAASTCLNASFLIGQMSPTTPVLTLPESEVKVCLQRCLCRFSEHRSPKQRTAPTIGPFLCSDNTPLPSPSPPWPSSPALFSPQHLNCQCHAHGIYLVQCLFLRTRCKPKGSETFAYFCSLLYPTAQDTSSPTAGAQ